jgi:hypothetical protein
MLLGRGPTGPGQARGAGGGPRSVQVATRTRAKSGRANAQSLYEPTRDGGGRRPWAAPQSVPGHHRPGPGHGLGLDEGQSALQVLSGPSPGVGRELTRGPHGLLPLRRDPRPATLPRVSRLRPSLTPGRTSGPRGQEPEQTNPGPGKPRADARIRNPSGPPPAPGLTRTKPRVEGEVRGRIVFPSGILLLKPIRSRHYTAPLVRSQAAS